MPADHPHILKLCSDEHSPFLAGFAGDPWVRTPNLDRLAAEGTVFENAYCANPICVPGRNAMITGKLVRDVGTVHYHDVLPSGLPTYMRTFSRCGYQTTCVGKMHFHGEDQMHGWLFRPYGDMEIVIRPNFPGYDPEGDVAANIKYDDKRFGLSDWVRTAGPGETGFILFDKSVTREACIHLRDYFKWMIYPVYDARRPLLFEVSWKLPHWPFTAPQALFDHYRGIVGLPERPFPEDPPAYIAAAHDRDQPADITDEQILNARAAYWALCEWMDTQIGIVLDVLEELGVRDEFVVHYTSDHGEMAGEHGLWGKHCFYEESVCIPLILHGPGIPAGRRVRENVSHVDVYPTLCDIAGLEPPGGLRGRSVMPLLERDTRGERIVFSELYVGPHASLMAKQGDLKYVWYSEGEAQLFDLARDPRESVNFAGHPDYADAKSRLYKALESLPEPWDATDPDWAPPPGMPFTPA